MNFWQNLPKPVVGLAPMDGVTDAPFRFITAKHGKPDVIITEFVSVDGIYHGSSRLFEDFLYHEVEKPVVAQIYGKDPKLFYLAAKVACTLGFDGIDINMGCPSRSVAARGSGAALINTPDLARQIITATKKGVNDWVSDGFVGLPQKTVAATNNTKMKLRDLGIVFDDDRKQIPVSVKTRIGLREVVITEWVNNLLEAGAANITMHGRTLKQTYTGNADWNSIAEGAQIVRGFNKGKEAEDRVTYIGNGDITNPNVAVERIAQSGVDGVLIGRAAMGNPWIFRYKNQIRDLKKNIVLEDISVTERVEMAIEHSRVFERVKQLSPFVQMRKHLGWYMKSFPGASEVRMKLMQTNSSKDVVKLLRAL
ncbi:MAG: tRNA dihydrouridine synthase [Candidatus Dojkabacteria bacterium]